MRNPVLKSERRRLMSPAAPYVEQAVARQTRMTLLAALGCFLIGWGAMVWNWQPASEWAVPMVGVGCALSITGLMGILYNERAIRWLVTVEDVVSTTEREGLDPAEGKLVATLVPSPGVPNQIKSGPVRFTSAQWSLIYTAVESAGWKFSRPILAASGANIASLNSKYTKLYPWLEQMGLILNARPGQAKNPDFMVTKKGARVFDAYSSGHNPLLTGEV